MATLLLSLAGSTLGSAVGLGSLGSALGRAAGGIAGNMIDQSLLGGGGNRIVEGPRLKEVDGLASTEGAAIPRVYGRARLGGQLIWATRFEEEITTTVTRAKSGGKGGPKAQRTYETTYSYHANLAIGLCEGPIAFVRRVWADGRELDVSTVQMRVHNGYENQQPDPLISAKEAGATPAYRGLAYVVFERLALAEYGNRVPQFSFEVVRAVDGLGGMIRAVTLIPGASEFIYDVRPISHESEPGVTQSETRHQLHGGADVDVAINQLRALCPSLRRISLVVSWFGDDLRAGSCTIAPRVEISHKPTIGAEWFSAGLDRASARLVSVSGGHAAYGGTPSDESVTLLIRRLREVHGLEVVLYPFVMMDIPAGNELIDPQTGAPGQPPYPWRGRITCSPAPGVAGTVDGSDEAAGQIAALLGTLAPADFSLEGERVVCARPEEWSFRRHILHYAKLAAVAGGVDGFVIGSELVGLTRVRGALGYPMVDGLVALASDVRAILPSAKLVYAADWTEYGAHVREGGQEVRFPLDPLWASPALDAIGIDFYAPLSDCRDTSDHADTAIARGPADLGYLRSRLNAGEAYDWYYADMAGRIAQQRLPITDGAYGKPWIYRAKDLPNWWGNPHIERSAGVETSATAWVPGSKPIWLTEIGLPAVDKGGNSPNVFPDPKSVDGGYPHFSSRARDDLVQARGLEAIISGLDPARVGFEAARNPVHPGTGIRMVDPANIFVWTWDARPFPAFPDLQSVWADGPNWETGHWINGRLEGTPVDRLIRAILADFGLPMPDELVVDGFVDGYVLDRPLSARAVLEPLAQAFGFDVTMSAGRLSLRGRGGKLSRALGFDELLLDRDGRPYELRRAQESELPRELRLSYSDGDSDYRRATARSRRLAGAAIRENSVETAIVTRPAEGQRLADQRLQEAWAGRETIELDLSPRCIDLEPGDVVSLPVDGHDRLYRLTRISDGTSRKASGRAVEPAIYASAGVKGPGRVPRPAPSLPGRPMVVPLDLPIVRTQPVPLLSLAAFASPWPGALAIWRADPGGPFTLHSLVEAPSIVGETLTALPPGPLWRTDRSAALDVKLRGGTLSAVSPEAALAGANALALLDAAGSVEIVTVARVELIGPQRFRLSELIRGLGGSEPAAARSLPAGSRVIVLDGAAVPLATELADLGRPSRYRIGPVQLDLGDPALAEITATATGTALLPLAPVHPRARRSSAGVTFSWIRRSRIDGDSWDLTEIPLGEEVERYEIGLLNDAGTIRTGVAATQSWLYPAAQELADFGSSQAEFELVIAQTSAIMGRGQEWRGRVRVR
ncbi:hypothetical protein DWF00_06385 [Bosea caraganae]|uniref:Host specificity protein n=1 Tax=Bosea caraganae TaxID=2763117 RepID=A0A370L3I2_9HYPH|nr:glycoside hydrolase/phage tail family protein [Bosea caraganae]RDJ22987.1 hypothetical protein DWE98_17630 [Bosea caraganae]RDJ28767.1 hypothetical protein DWF00_06385 [Bosea caraganae]